MLCSILPNKKKQPIWSNYRVGTTSSHGQQRPWQSSPCAPSPAVKPYTCCFKSWKSVCGPLTHIPPQDQTNLPPPTTPPAAGSPDPAQAFTMQPSHEDALELLASHALLKIPAKGHACFVAHSSEIQLLSLICYKEAFIWNFECQSSSHPAAASWSWHWYSFYSSHRTG